jgi:hypothetical protein
VDRARGARPPSSTNSKARAEISEIAVVNSAGPRMSTTAARWCQVREINGVRVSGIENTCSGSLWTVEPEEFEIAFAKTRAAAKFASFSSPRSYVRRFRRS